MDSGRVWRSLKAFRSNRPSKHKSISDAERSKACEALKDLCLPDPLRSDPSAGPSTIRHLHRGYSDLSLRYGRADSPSPSAPLSSRLSPLAHSALADIVHSNINREIIKPINEDELAFAIKSIKNKFAHGSDCVGADFVNGMSCELMKVLLRLLNKIFNYRSYPLSWREYFIIFIPKPGSDKLCPIFLANILFEKIIYFRLNRWAESLSLIPDFQFGFWRGRSVENSLLILSTEIKISFARKRRLGAIFLDIKVAFDNVNPTILKEILGQLGLPSKISDFVSFVISDRYLSNYLGGYLLGRNRASRGLPQSSSLSPILHSTSFLTRDLLEYVLVLLYVNNIVVLAFVWFSIICRLPIFIFILCSKSCSLNFPVLNKKFVFLEIVERLETIISLKT